MHLHDNVPYRTYLRMAILQVAHTMRLVSIINSHDTYQDN